MVRKNEAVRAEVIDRICFVIVQITDILFDFIILLFRFYEMCNCILRKPVGFIRKSVTHDKYPYLQQNSVKLTQRFLPALFLYWELPFQNPLNSSPESAKFFVPVCSPFKFKSQFQCFELLKTN